MRSFLFTLLLFGLLIGIMTVNAAAIHHLAEEINALIDTLPSRAEGNENSAISALTDIWANASGWVSLSVGYDEINRISQFIVMIRIYYAEGSDADYRSACDQLRLALEDLCRFERLHFDNLI